MKTDASGSYSLSAVAGGNDTVTASKPGISFSQPTLTLPSLSANQKNADFLAAGPTPTPPPTSTSNVQFSSGAYVGSESGGQTDITLTRSGSHNHPANLQF